MPIGSTFSLLDSHALITCEYNNNYLSLVHKLLGNISFILQVRLVFFFIRKQLLVVLKIMSQLMLDSYVKVKDYGIRTFAQL